MRDRSFTDESERSEKHRPAGQPGNPQKLRYIANYEGRTRGGKRFVSSTYFIKEKGELVGLICVNHDVEDFFALSEHLNNLVQAFSLPVGGTYPTTYTENLTTPSPGYPVA